VTARSEKYPSFPVMKGPVFRIDGDGVGRRVLDGNGNLVTDAEVFLIRIPDPFDLLPESCFMFFRHGKVYAADFFPVLHIEGRFNEVLLHGRAMPAGIGMEFQRALGNQA